MQTVFPPIRDGYELNPGKGWMLMMPGHAPDDDAMKAFRPLTSMVYYRVNWCDLEPEEGKFAWDHPRWEGDFKRWTEAGYPVGLDVMCCNPHGGEYCTPKWVRDAGCKGHYYRRDSGDPMHHGQVMDRWEPDYDDPIFQEKLENFLTALAQRYDADPMVEFVTLRSYAAWGEWWGTEAKVETLNWMVDTHIRLFRQTQLLIPVSAEVRWDPVIKPALRRGLGLRKDGLGGPIHPGEGELFDLCYNRAPAILEFWGPRSYLKGRGWDKLFDKEECIYGWHASRVNMGLVGQAREWVEHEPDFLDRAAARMGYRFKLHQATFNDRIATGTTGDRKTFVFDAWWRNLGVAPYTRTGCLLVILRDSNGHETVIHRDRVLLNHIRPIGHFQGRYEIDLPRDLRAGSYTLLVAMEDDHKGRVTPIRMAHADDARGRVELGPVMVE